MVKVQKAHWRDTAIARSEVITDAWEVTKAYACRVAEWILFCCMVMNIIEILPAVMLGTLVNNIVLATQAVTLDIAGFGLASMADHARRMGDEEAARRAEWTGYLLITIMVVTIALVTCGALWPVTRWFTDPAEKVLILVRVVMTVVYGHVLHGLRRVEHTHAKSLRPDVLEEMAATFNQQIQDLHTQLEMLAAQPSQVETSKLDALHTMGGAGDTISVEKCATKRHC